MLVALILIANILRIGTLSDYPHRYELSETRHSSATAPPPAPETTSEAVLAAQPTAQSAPEILAKTAVEPTLEAPAKIESAAEPTLEASTKIRPAARAARAQARPMKKRASRSERLYRRNDSFMNYLIFGPR